MDANIFLLCYCLCTNCFLRFRPIHKAGSRIRQAWSKCYTYEKNFWVRLRDSFLKSYILQEMSQIKIMNDHFSFKNCCY